MNFYGYKRPDGRVGVRNKVLILPASVCASDTTRIISQQVVGSVTFNNQLGCSQVASDQQFTMDVMAGYAANPNVYGTVVVSLGCENCQMDLVVEAIRERTNKPLKQVIIQEAGGTLKAIDMAVRYAKEMVEEASLLQREEFPMSELIIIPRLIGCGEVGQSDLAKVVGDHVVQALPHRIGAAVGHPFAGGSTGHKAAHGGKAALGQQQDLCHGVLVGGAGQPVAAALAAQTFQKAVLHQHLQDVFQIFFRDLLPFGDLLQRHIPLRLVFGQVDHYAQCVTALG